MNRRPTDAPTRTRRSPAAFFILVFVLTIPFIVLGAIVPAEIVPGVPLSGFAFVCPVIAAVVLTYRDGRGAGVRELLKRSYDAHRVTRKGWYLPTLLLYPAVLVLSYVVIRLQGTDVPAPGVTVGPLLLLTAGFFVGALAEELGWAGYAQEPMQERWGALGAGLLIGVVWAAWHWVPLLQVGRSVAWIGWWTIATIALRVLMAWLFNNTGRSVFVLTLFHLMINLGWQSFPVNGSHFDQRSTAVILVVVAGVVTVAYGPRTLTGSPDR